MSTEQLFISGDKIYNRWIKKSGTIKYLRNNDREKYCRKCDPTHYYYHIDYVDGSFNTYVSQNDLDKYNINKYNNVDPKANQQIINNQYHK